MLNASDKQSVLAGYWRRFGPYRFVVETGIWNGHGSAQQFKSDMVEYVAVEIDPASARLAWGRGFDVRVGDSHTILPFLLAARNEPAFFWLDAHFNPEVEGDAFNDAHPCPLLAELEAILGWPHAAGSVVLIDDMRLLGAPGWPAWVQLAPLLGLWDASSEDDILRLTPRA